MTLENLVVVLTLVGVAFFNLVLPWLRRRHGERQDAESGNDVEQAAQEELPAPAPTWTMPMPPEAPATAPARPGDLPGRPRVPSAPGVPPGPGSRPRPSPVASLADARRGIVLGTILGPCRAVQPIDPASN